MELDVDSLADHLRDAFTQVFVEEFGLLGTHGLDHLKGEVHVHRLVAKHPVGAGGQPIEEALGAQKVDVGECAKEEQALDAGCEAHQVEQEPLSGLVVVERLVADLGHPLEAELALAANRRDVFDGRECFGPFVVIGDVVVEQGQVELDMERLFVELARQIHAGFGCVDVLVEVEHQIVGHDRVAGGEERHEPADQVLLGRHELAVEIDEIVGEIDFFDGPGVFDGVAVHLVELRVAHGPQCEIEAGFEDVGTLSWLGGAMPEGVGLPISLGQFGAGEIVVGEGHQSHASQVSGFSSEQAMASASVNDFFLVPPPGVGPPVGPALVVVLLMRVAGRLRR